MHERGHVMAASKDENGREGTGFRRQCMWARSVDRRKTWKRALVILY